VKRALDWLRGKAEIERYMLIILWVTAIGAFLNGLASFINWLT
jgi:hypothetical protein